MFVRWKKRMAKNERSYSLAAYLVQSVRVGGKPRQKVLAHLCTIKSQNIEKEDARLWCRIEDAVKKLELPGDVEERVYTSIAEKTPRPAAQKIAESRVERDALDKALGVDAYMKEISSHPVVPDIPNALVNSPTTAINELLFLLWQVDLKRPEDASLVNYTLFLAKAVAKRKPEIVRRLGKIPAKAMKGDTERNYAWRAFWFDVHFSLCLVASDYEQYCLVRERVAQWVKLPTEEEFAVIIMGGLRLSARVAEREYNTAKARYDRTFQKWGDVYTVIDKSRDYLGIQ